MDEYKAVWLFIVVMFSLGLLLVLPDWLDQESYQETCEWHEIACPVEGWTCWSGPGSSKYLVFPNEATTTPKCTKVEIFTIQRD